MPLGLTWRARFSPLIEAFLAERGKLIKQHPTIATVALIKRCSTRAYGAGQTITDAWSVVPPLRTWTPRSGKRCGAGPYDGTPTKGGGGSRRGTSLPQ